MKKPISPLLVIAALVGIFLLVGVTFWQQNKEPEGRVQSNLGPAEQDPVKFRKGVEELLARERAEKAKK